MTPARIPQAITVGSYDRNLNFSDFSNFGCILDILTPGSEVISTYIDSQYAVASGTSMACGVASGVMGLVLTSEPTLDAYQAYNKLFQLSNQPLFTYPTTEPANQIVISQVPPDTIDLSACASSF